MIRKNLTGILALALFVAPAGLAKTKKPTADDGSQVRAGTKISASLESAVDAKTATPGDAVTAKATSNVKQNGKVVIHKGDKLLGHVTSVQADSSGHEGSSLGIAFDRLESGGATTELHTVVSALVSTSVRQSDMMGDEMPAMGPVASPVAGGGGGGGRGGLIGGTTGAVGSTVGAVGSTAGNVGGTVGGVAQSGVGNSTQGTLATPVKMIHVDSAVQAEGSAGTASTLSTSKGDLRLDSGTRMELRVVAQGSAQAK